MSSPFADSPNPYAASIIQPMPAPIMPVGPLQDRMEYMRAYNFIFENPNWLTTVVLLGLVLIAAIIPGVSIILQLLFVGYQFETIDWLLRTGGRQYPAFDFGRIGDYFGRGLWPFLVSLVTSFGMMAVFYLGMGVAVFGGAGLASLLGDDAAAAVGAVIGFIAVIFLLVFAFFAAFYLTAMTIRSGLAQDFGSAFNFAWLRDFVGKMWVEMLLGFLFLGATAVILEILGLLALCIGILFVIPLIMLAHAHLMYQFYVVYLSRGGIPVATKTAPYTSTMQPPLPPPPPPGYSK